MPYKNIIFIKLEKRLLNDHRWYMMSEPAQLIYIKLILLAAETYNKIPKNDAILKEALRSRLELPDFIKCLEEIRKKFPKFTTGRHFTYFKEFEYKTNYIPNREIPGKSQGLPKDGVDKEEDKDKNKSIYINNTFIPKKVKIYKAPDPKDKFKFVPEVNEILKKLGGNRE